MKHIFTITLLALGSLTLSAQTDSVKVEKDTVPQDTFIFTTVKENPISSIKNQKRSSTCWAFSTLSFVEAELMRMGKPEYDLAEMFVVHHTMLDRATNYVRLHGSSSFRPGGSFADVMECFRLYGIVPQEAMPGIMYGDTLPNHGELDRVAEGYVNALIKGNVKKLTPVWRDGLSAIYDAYLGKCPESFTYEGKTYTPQSFLQMLGFNPDDYVSITSYTHHPFYTQFAIEVEDNWRQELSWNIPLDEMMQIIDNALDKGYTIAWGADVSETGFTRNGIGVMPDEDKGAELTGTDQARWTGMTTSDKKKELTKGPLPEVEVTQEMRQKAYDNWETTDDHGMQIYGIAKDQNGKEYYMVKNSWGKTGNYDGIWYISKAFTAYKTMNFLVHKDALPKEIRKKLNL